MNGGKAVAEEAENCEEEVFSDCNTGGLCLKVHHRTYVVGNLPSTKRFFRRCAHMFCEGGCPLRMFFETVGVPDLLMKIPAKLWAGFPRQAQTGVGWLRELMNMARGTWSW